MTVPNNLYQNYDTDQFEDPYNGFTVHDDGTDTYTSPYTRKTYLKIRTYNGIYTDHQARTYQSYMIRLVPL